MCGLTLEKDDDDDDDDAGDDDASNRVLTDAARPDETEQPASYRNAASGVHALVLADLVIRRNHG